MPSSEAMPRSALAKRVRGVSTRNYEEVVESIREGFGIQRSSIGQPALRESHGQALYLLEQTACWLDKLSPDAAASLREGREETLTVVRAETPRLLTPYPGDHQPD